MEDENGIRHRPEGDGKAYEERGFAETAGDGGSSGRDFRTM